MKVLVTDGSSRPALAITRSLGRRGHEVIVAETHSPSLAQTSRYCAGRVEHPDIAHDEAGALAALTAAVERQGIGAIVPVTDVSVSLVTRNRARFEPACQVPFADAAVIARANDKADLLRTAERLGVPTPRSWYVDRPGTAPPADLPFPIVLKPHRSRVRVAGGWLACGVRHAETPAALAADLRARAPEEFPIILQERIAGHGIGVFACYARGRAVAWFSHRRVREKPPWGGVSVLSESVAVPPQAGEFAARLLGALGWHGVAMVEFKLDPRDGEPKLMEINPRFWGSLQLAIDSGVDFPAVLIDAVVGGRPAEPAPYRVGVKSRWFWGDFDSLLLRLGAGADAPPAPDGLGRLAAVWQYLALWKRDVFYDNPKPYDVRPWLFESAEWFRRLT